MSFWSAWWRRRAAGAPDTARPEDGPAGDGEGIGVEHPLQLLHQRRNAAGLLKFDADRVITDRFGVDQKWRTVADFAEEIQRQFDSRPAGDLMA